VGRPDARLYQKRPFAWTHSYALVWLIIRSEFGLGNDPTRHPDHFYGGPAEYVLLGRPSAVGHAACRFSSEWPPPGVRDRRAANPGHRAGPAGPAPPVPGHHHRWRPSLQPCTLTSSTSPTAASIAAVDHQGCQRRRLTAAGLLPRRQQPPRPNQGHRPLHPPRGPRRTQAGPAFLTTSELWLRTDPPLPLNVDGDIRGHTLARITLAPEALHIVVAPSFPDT
jgi:hypothetical protein